MIYRQKYRDQYKIENIVKYRNLQYRKISHLMLQYRYNR